LSKVKKLLFLKGIPTYGVSFTLVNSKKNHQINAPIVGRGRPGEITNNEGTLAFYEICNRTMMRNWKTYQDPKLNMGPYSWGEKDQWVGYDSPISIHKKMKLISEYGLGGAMVW
jgi:GH18 family chitinase